MLTRDIHVFVFNHAANRAYRETTAVMESRTARFALKCIVDLFRDEMMGTILAYGRRFGIFIVGRLPLRAFRVRTRTARIAVMESALAVEASQAAAFPASVIFHIRP